MMTHSTIHLDHGDDPRIAASLIGPSWLLQAKVVAPALPPGYLRRTSLEGSVRSVLERRLTVLQAPAGFGKTTLLADIWRRKRADGVTVAWLSLDQDDGPEVFGNYLARAIQHAGVELAPLQDSDVWSSLQFNRQFGMLARTIEAHAAPCLLLLDEVERLPGRTVELLDLLVKRSPPNLHLAVACRFNPGLDLMPYVLDGSAIVLEAEQFRFSRPEIVRLYGGSLSSSEVKVIEERTAGWPVAIMIDRNTSARAAEGPVGGLSDSSANFIGVRLLRGVSVEDRAFLFDLAVFDWIGADLVDEVLGSSDARLRVLGLVSLDGLFLPSEEDPDVRRLHPLVQEFCLGQLAKEDPERKRLLHRRLAVALDRRGHHRLAWRHAASAADGRLVGQLIEKFGGFELWLREGANGLEAASEFMTPRIMGLYPRLGLLWSVALSFSQRPVEAAALYESVRGKTDNFTRDRDGGDNGRLVVDAVFAESVLKGVSLSSPESELDGLVPPEGPPERASVRDRVILGGWNLLRCSVHSQFADFEESRNHGENARAFFAGDMPQGELFATAYLGIDAMAQGRIPEALESYHRARRLARRFFPSDWKLAASVDVLLMELDLERNRQQAVRQRALRNLTIPPGVWNEPFVAAVGVRAELTWQQYEGDAVIEYLRLTQDAVREADLQVLVTHVSLLLVLYLARTGEIDRAVQVWRASDQGCEPADILNPEGRSWRTVEALWNARLVLLAGQGDFRAAGELADAGWRVAARYGVSRVVLRCLGLSMTAAYRSGEEDRALDRLAEALRVLRQVDYYRALANEREISCTLLRKLLDASDDPDLRELARAALEHLGERSAPAPEFSARELDVLAELRNGLRNREIAGLLGITEDGVRFHLRNIYGKTGVSERRAAVRYAEGKGLLP